MTGQRAIRILGPVTVGSALVGVSLFIRADAEGDRPGRSLAEKPSPPAGAETPDASAAGTASAYELAPVDISGASGITHASPHRVNLPRRAWPRPAFGASAIEHSDAAQLNPALSVHPGAGTLVPSGTDVTAASVLAEGQMRNPAVRQLDLPQGAQTRLAAREVMAALLALKLPQLRPSLAEASVVLIAEREPEPNFALPKAEDELALSVQPIHVSAPIVADPAPDPAVVRPLERGEDGARTASRTIAPRRGQFPLPLRAEAAEAAPRADRITNVGHPDVPVADDPADPGAVGFLDHASDTETAVAVPGSNSPAIAAQPMGERSVATPETALADEAQLRQDFDLSPGRQTFPAADDAPTFTYDDELILQIRVAGVDMTDTILAYGTRAGVYLPLGELARLLDLAIVVSDDGNYASGWFLSENRRLIVDLRNGEITTAGGTRPLPRGLAQAMDGELFLRSDVFATIFPLTVEPDLRASAVRLETREPFPFEERLAREAERARLASRGGPREPERWPREETPWLLASVPIGDVEVRAVTDSARGARGEGDLRLAGDLAMMTAQTFLSGDTEYGLTAALVQLGRRDVDGDLLGPLRATEFQMGDVATRAMPIGLTGTSGRGTFVTNEPFETLSVFDQIDLRGVLPDGYEVELYRNDVLVGSTREETNGQYEFLQVAVDYGLNVFRLVFYGPQGQRREEVRRVSVGGGQLAQGQLVYSLGAVQRGVNLLGVRGPNFSRGARYGDWQAVGEVSYGVSAGVTALASGAVFEQNGEMRWIGSGGIRTGIGAFALRADGALSDDGGVAAGVGLGGRALGGSFVASHFEYRGNFLDEVRTIGTTLLRRATELDFNTSIPLGGRKFAFLPVSLRARNIAYSDGRARFESAVRSSLRFPGMIASANLEYTRSGNADGRDFSQLMGNFDLATFNRSDTQLRATVGYRALPELALTTVGAQVNHALDDRTVLRASAVYSFTVDDLGVGLSAIREFDTFTLALDGRHTLREGDYSLALRLGFSFGRDPLRDRFFVDQPGQASSGALAIRAFRDLDGDRIFSEGDEVLPDVNFAVFNSVATTDSAGLARMGELGNGNRVSVQVDPSSLPDILLAPVSRGIEIVPRAGRFHVTDFPIVALSEVEGTVTFAGANAARGVSGLRLQLRDASGNIAHHVRTERGGYYFFEQVMPGTYDLIVDPEQAERLDICLTAPEPLTVGAGGDIITRDMTVTSCAELAEAA
ncbi:hypothetical protein [Aurantiacibacter spongiae]|uniref:NOMO second beta-sandwich domain-containing protein n=1 Tax=Aurantiacibacter spongiae TaxID=2488860 RepID=A0A3N5CU88_9SPHN|nr:hypothetical protein [Aurantiacibacter spongiae]RPF72277.1 hypothetical protein EG799_12065 [Aurantiacibacter spongiae]